MSNTQISPTGIASPVANYVHAMKSTMSSSMVHTSGVVPITSDGDVPDDITQQARTVWANISAILAEAAMTAVDIVSVTTYVTPGQDMAAVMAERDSALGNHRAASTLVIVAELAQPAWKMEVSVVAAR